MQIEQNWELKKKQNLNVKQNNISDIDSISPQLKQHSKYKWYTDGIMDSAAVRTQANLDLREDAPTNTWKMEKWSEHDVWKERHIVLDTEHIRTQKFNITKIVTKYVQLWQFAYKNSKYLVITVIWCSRETLWISL